MAILVPAWQAGRRSVEDMRDWVSPFDGDMEMSTGLLAWRDASPLPGLPGARRLAARFKGPGEECA
jgi:hypothetical protein